MPEVLVNSLITGRESKALLNWKEKQNKETKTQIKKSPPDNNMWINSSPIFIGGCNLSAEGTVLSINVSPLHALCASPLAPWRTNHALRHRQKTHQTAKIKVLFLLNKCHSRRKFRPIEPLWDLVSCLPTYVSNSSKNVSHSPNSK